jgi:hypothetical protein
MSLDRLARDRYRLWRRRYRVFMLGRFDWYKRRHARKRIREIVPGNTRVGVDIEEDLYMLGIAVLPVLNETLDDPTAPEAAKRAVLHVLAGLAEPRCLEVLDRVAREAEGGIRAHAEKELQAACRRLAKRGRLPAQYAGWVGPEVNEDPPPPEAT